MSYGYAPAPFPPQPVPQPNWFSRNWKWFIPTIIVGPILLLVLFIGALFTLGMSVIKSSEPYQHAVSSAANDTRVAAQLGAPITPGWYAGGRFHSTGPRGDVNLFIPLKGTLKHGTVYVVATKSDDETWRYHRLEVAIDGQPGRINLLTKTTSPPAEEK